jgi:hypothetical protein
MAPSIFGGESKGAAAGTGCLEGGGGNVGGDLGVDASGRKQGGGVAGVVERRRHPPSEFPVELGL